MITSIDFRNSKVDVEYHDHGYEPDTNCHEIDWNFIDNEFKQLELTQEEEDSIYLQLSMIEPSYFEDDVI